VVTSPSPLQRATHETRQALDEIRRHDQLMADSWRRQLEAASSTLAQIAGEHANSRTLRSVRALASTGASESALAAQFEARLVKLSDRQLREVSAGLEHDFATVRSASADAAAQLTSATEDLLAELRAELAVAGGAAIAGSALRHQERFVDDVMAAMRSHADRTERLLLELGEAAHAAVGAPAGGLLPTRESHVPPRPALDHIAVEDAARLADELSTAVRRSVDLFRDRLAGQVEEAIDTLGTRVEQARQCHALGEEAARERADQLAWTAQRLRQLAEELDWMLTDDR